MISMSYSTDRQKKATPTKYLGNGITLNSNMDKIGEYQIFKLKFSK